MTFEKIIAERPTKTVYKYNGKTIKLGSTKAQMTEALGEPVSSEAAGTCGKQGTLHRYVFSSLTVEVLDSGDGGTVDYISLNDDLVTTDKNIRIGSSKEDVVSSYGEPSADDGNNIRYNEGNFTLKFGIGDGKVTSITLIRTTAE